MRSPLAQRRNQAFTLTEMIVASLLLIALAALMLPVFGRARQHNQGIACMNKMRQLYVALMSYRSDHSGYLPPGKLLLREEQGGVNLRHHLVPNYLPELLYCPLMKLSASGLERLLPGETEKERLGQLGGYAMNSFLTGVKLEGLPGPHWGGHRYPGDSKMLFISESVNGGLVWADSHLRAVLNGYDVSVIRVAPRDHGSKSLYFMFLDGHAARITPKVKSDGTYDWSEHFDSWGKDGRYINARQNRGPTETATP